jgi:hypothetical protein
MVPVDWCQNSKPQISPRCVSRKDPVFWTVYFRGMMCLFKALSDYLGSGRTGRALMGRQTGTYLKMMETGTSIRLLVARC